MIAIYPIPVMNAIENTPGAEVLPDGRIKMDVSRYQKPQQGGMCSIRTGVFYLPELTSPYHKHYKQQHNKSPYGGSVYLTGTVILQKPYTIQAGTGGLGPEKAFGEVYGKDTLKQLIDDIYKVMNSSKSGYTKSGKYVKIYNEDSVIDFLDKWDGDVDLAYEIIRNSSESNCMRYALQEHIIAHKLREKGYDSVLSYSKHKGMFHLSELFDLRQMEYPDESGFHVQEKHTTHIITSYKVYELVLTKDVGV